MPASSSLRHASSASAAVVPLFMKASEASSPLSVPMLMPVMPRARSSRSSAALFCRMSLTRANMPIVRTFGRKSWMRSASRMSLPALSTKGLAPTRKTRRARG